ncbi:MAG: DNA cytosine methyltransferase [Curtobacterium sp.]
MSELTLTDLFCGAGGSSSGAANVPGVRVRMAANHWDIAISTHQTNHTDADHDIADLSQVDPRRYPRTTILWASPSCTNHTQAKGVSRATQVDEWSPYDGRPLPKEAAERSRATMWDVPRFAEYHRYAAVVVENVVDAAKWVLFPAWLSAMTALGYEHEIVWLNSMHAQAYGAPAPQSRDRMYVVFWRAGNRRPDLQKWTKPFASCPEHGVVQCVQVFKRADGTRWGRYRAQYVYRCPHRACRVGTLEPGWLPASSIIDWSLRGQRIGDRQKPLATKTRERIRLGIQRHWGPLVVEAAGNAYDCTDPKHRAHGDPNGYVRAWPASEPLKTLHTTASKAVVVADPLLVPVEGREGKTAAASTLPLRTQSTRNETALLIPMRNHNTAKTVGDPLDTVAAAGNHHALLMRNQSGGAEMTTPAAEPMRTLTTRGDQSLLAPAGRLSADVNDCEFRMLEPHEIKRGIAFDDDYVLHGSKRAQVRLAGDAVTPPAARDLIAAVAESLGIDVELAPFRYELAA